MPIATIMASAFHGMIFYDKSRDISRKVRLESSCVYGLESSDTDEVCNSLVQIGCTEKAVESAREHCLRGMPNTGLTYSNLAGRKSVVAVSRTTTEYEFVNTVTHEMFHVVTHICESLGIDLKDEEPCYMMGWLCQAVSRIFI